MAVHTKKLGGGKLSRSETVTVRLDPKLRYLAELAARKQRRTLSSYIEWAIEDSLSKAVLSESGSDQNLADDAWRLWDVDEADRFAKLALRYPNLLTHDEQVLWKVVRECGLLWRGNYALRGKGAWTWQVEEGSLLFERLREHWKVLKQVSSGAAPVSSLPKWEKTKVAQASGFDDMDDDIPF